MKRLWGLLLIIRALAPILVVVVIAVALNIVFQDVARVLDRPIQTLQKEIDGVKSTLDRLRGDIDAVAQDVTSLVNRLHSFSLANLIPNIPNSIHIPSIHIPPLNVPVPTNVKVVTSTINIGVSISYPSDIKITTSNLPIAIPDISNLDIPVPNLNGLSGALRSALAPITDVFKDFDKAFSSFDKLNQTLQPLPQHLSAIVKQGEAMLSGLQQLIARWGGTLAVVIVILLVLVVIYFAVPLLEDLNRGWRLLRGLSTN